MKQFFLDLINPNSEKSTARVIALLAFLASVGMSVYLIYTEKFTENMYLYFILGWGGSYVLRQFAPQGKTLEAVPNS